MKFPKGPGKVKIPPDGDWECPNCEWYGDIPPPDAPIRSLPMEGGYCIDPEEARFGCAGCGARIAVGIDGDGKADPEFLYTAVCRSWADLKFMKLHGWKDPNEAAADIADGPKA